MKIRKFDFLELVLGNKSVHCMFIKGYPLFSLKNPRTHNQDRHPFNGLFFKTAWVSRHRKG